MSTSRRIWLDINTNWKLFKYEKKKKPRKEKNKSVKKENILDDLVLKKNQRLWHYVVLPCWWYH